MNESPDSNSKLRTTLLLAWAAVVVTALPFLYALSMGPAMWLATHGYISPEAKQVCSHFYEPLWLAARYVPILKSFLHWYISFWGQ